MSLHYDDLPINDSILLDLPMREGIGTITKDVAKPHHPVTLVNTPTWTELASGLTVLTLDGASEYLQCLNADSADLGFTSGAFSYSCWFYWDSTSVSSDIIAGRYELDIGGWEIYTYDDPNGYLTFRVHHAGGSAVRTACYSGPWDMDTWNFLGISKESTANGGQAIHYKNGLALTTTGVLEEPEATTSDLVLGVRYTKDADFYKGMIWRPRVWGRAVSQAQWAQMYERERGWFE